MVVTVATLPAVKDHWVRTYDAALLLRNELGSGRDWHSWLKEDRRERHVDCSHVICFRVGEHVFYDSADIHQLIADIKAGCVNPKHSGDGKVTEPVIQRVKGVDGVERIKVVTNGRVLAPEETRKLIFRLAAEYKSLLTKAAMSKVLGHA